MTRTEFLREQTISGANKCKRAPFTYTSVADEPCSLPERKALALKYLFDNMPVYIGEQELIVGTRTLFPPNRGNEDGRDIHAYGLATRIPYVNEAEKELFGYDKSYDNKTHFTPDFEIILAKGIDGIISYASERKNDEALIDINRDFLSGVIVAYSGLKNLIKRYEKEALLLAESADEERRAELLEIARVCGKISSKKAESFREAVQLLWFAHLGAIVESFEFINYGRLDVILGKYLGDDDREEAQQIIDCLLLKMYDQADLITTYLGSYAAQLVITLGGVLQNGEDAVNPVTMFFLDALGRTRLPDPEFNLRISSKNPPEFLDKAARLTISGCNNVSYYNDDLFVESLNRAGLEIELARDYAFDLCQDINVPGKGDFYMCGGTPLANVLMDFLRQGREYSTFDALFEAYKEYVARDIERRVKRYNDAEERLVLYREGKIKEYTDAEKKQSTLMYGSGNSPMSPLLLLSALYHGSVKNGLDVAFNPHPIKEKGYLFGSSVEAINSLAAIKKTVFEDGLLTLDEIWNACENDYNVENGEMIRAVLWSCPKWGNDDEYVDSIAKELLEFCLAECEGYRTYLGGRVLGGIHQPHPVMGGHGLMATPEGRKSGAPLAVTLTPESGTMKNGPTAALSSASRIDPMLVHWNYCVMVNYFSSVFDGNKGDEIFKTLLGGYFAKGGLQHQPNILNIEELKRAQLEPEKYKDLIVRLWGVSAHFVDLPRELQDELIARFS